MKNILMASIFGVSAFFASTPAIAASTPVGVSTDQRVKTIVYNENDVVSLKGYYGYQTTISFAPYEKIQNISIGDSVSWQVVPNKAGNILFIKPVEERATTNMTVITDRRIYNFELTSGLAGSPRNSNITFMLKFQYPMDSVMDFSDQNGGPATIFSADRPYATKSEITENAISSVGAPRDLNFEYSYKGEEDIAPSTVFDNGEFTYFRFNNMSDLPAIFSVDKDRNESVVNYHLEDGYVVVESIGKQYTLRHGEDEACVFNDQFNSGKSIFTKREAS